MSHDPTHELVDRLADELEPVRPLPPLRWVIAAGAVLWAVVAAVGVAYLGPRSDLARHWLGGPGVSAVFAALAFAGAGGSVAALALGLPGREAVVRLAAAVAVAGMALAAGLGTVLFWKSPALHAPLSADLHCLAVSGVLGALPALAVVLFAGRAAPFRPLVIAVAAAAGAASLGSVVSQAACPMPDLGHLLVGHLLAPVAGVVGLSLPLLVVLRRLSRR